MVTVYNRAQLEKAIQPAELIKVTEEGLIAYAQGKAVVSRGRVAV